MWYVLYNVALILASPFILLTLVSKARCRRGLPQRLGFGMSRLLEQRADTRSTVPPVIWCHAVSLGEVTAITVLIRELHARYPDHRLLVSTVTETGREAVEQRLDGVASHFYAPLDFPGVVTRVVEAIRPQLFVFVETELWPNLLRTLARNKTPTVLVNGRLSTRSFQGYAMVRGLWTQALRCVSWFLMQSDRDVERIIALGAPPDRVRRTGNLKFDHPPPVAGPERRLTREGLGLREDEELIVAGSTHAGEDEPLLECYRQLHREFPNLVLMLAPRHIERAGELSATVRARGVVAARRSEFEEPSDGSAAGRPRVMILDTRGELAAVYRHAVLAYVGGTLIPVGGHNLLEPAQWGKPVFFGPYTDHCAEVAALLVGAGGGVQVRNGAELLHRMGEVLRDRAVLRDMGARAQGVVHDNRGALERNVAVIDHVLAQQRSGSGALAEPRAQDLLSSWQGRRIARPFLWLLSIWYGTGVRLRNRLYQEGWLRRNRLPRPVLSVGNLTVGGTGKTPVVIHLVNRLLAHGARVAVLSRGYGRKTGSEPVLVSDGRSLLAGPAEAGDEPHLIARRCPAAVVAVGGDRYRVGRWVLERFPVDCMVLDDGFQHRALERDVDLVLLDASDAAGLCGLLPAGRLREPIAGLARATALVITRAETIPTWPSELAHALSEAGPGRPVARIRFVAEAVVDVATGVARSPDVLNGRSGFVFSGIARPGSFRLLLSRCGLTVLGERVFPDHHAYAPSDVETIMRLAKERRAEMIVTTEKDATKVARLMPAACQIFALRLGTEIVEGRDELEALVLGLINRKPAVVCA